MVSGPNIKLNKAGVVCITVFVLYILYLMFLRQNGIAENKQVDLKNLLIGAAEVVVEGGKVVMSVYNSAELHVRRKGNTEEGAGTPVTDADIRSHCVMYTALTSTFPGVRVISEEHSSDCDSSFRPKLYESFVDGAIKLPSDLVNAEDVTVWIDPLDATQEFTEKLIQYVTTMICVAVKGTPVLGIIHFPFTKTTTWAWVGHGSSIPSPANNPSIDFSVITSRSHQGDVAQVLARSLGKDIKIIPAGGAGYKSVLVANQTVSAYVHTTNIKKWDICAGDALMRTLGGKMTTLTGEDIYYGADSSVKNEKGLLATVKGHAQLLSMLSTFLHS